MDLSELNSNVKEELILDQKISIPKEYYVQSDILELSDVWIKGTITKDNESNFVLQAQVTGKMTLQDSISLEPVLYPFAIEIQEEVVETLQNKENTIDLPGVLWQNIMLEIPLKFTKVNDFENFKGDGWKLVSEETWKEETNPFHDLKSMMGEE